MEFNQEETKGFTVPENPQSISITVPKGFKFKECKDGNVILELINKEPAEQLKPKYPLSVHEIKGREWFIDSRGDWKRITNRTVITKNHVSSIELAEAFIALIQLKELCNECNRIDGKTEAFNWNGEMDVYSVCLYENKFTTTVFCHTALPLTFIKLSTAEWFLETHKELIEKTRPLYE